MARSLAEQVDRAIENYMLANPQWTTLQVARVAVVSMRTPTHKMLKAACAAMSPGKRPTIKHVSVKAKHGIRYRAMIDAEIELEKP